MFEGKKKRKTEKFTDDILEPKIKHFMLCFREPRSSLVLFVSRYARSSLSHKNKIKIKMGRKFMLCWAAPFCSLSEWFLPHSPVLSCGLKLRVEWEWSQVGFVLFIPCRPWFSPFTAFPPQNGAMDALFFFFYKGSRHRHHSLCLL